MKKLLPILLAIILISGCRNEEESAPAEEENIQESEAKGPDINEDIRMLMEPYSQILEGLRHKDVQMIRDMMRDLERQSGQFAAETREDGRNTQLHKRLVALNEDLQDLHDRNEVREYYSLFNDISVKLFNILKAHTSSGRKIYYIYCPEARDGAGGYWLSREKGEPNPYGRLEDQPCAGIKDEI